MIRNALHYATTFDLIMIYPDKSTFSDVNEFKNVIPDRDAAPRGHKLTMGLPVEFHSQQVNRYT